MAPSLTVKHIELAERRVDFVQPFRFGDVTVEAAPQAFVHVEIEVDGRRSSGASAELMVPKWFDKNPALGVAETIAELRTSLRIARRLYAESRAPDTAFGIHAGLYDRQIEACAEAGLPALPSLFGPALIDKAILDALLRALGLDVFDGLKRNVVGLDNRLTGDIAPSELQAFLDGRSPPRAIHVRHTVGMVDPVESLREVAVQGVRYFKIKLCGDPDRDSARLESLSAALDDLRIDYRATLDANEQYAEQARLLYLVQHIASADRLAGLSGRLLYIEQPLPREQTWQTPLGEAARRFAFIIDEADDHYDAFPRAVRLGYRGISSKSCKGLYKSLLNGARAQAWSAERRSFITAEDLTCQAGLAVQQDTALAAFLGCTHVERNGHHYVDGFADTPTSEANAFLACHSDLYVNDAGRVRLRIEDGALSLASLRTPGFACAVAPENVGHISAIPIE
jgi:hypothetical protein